ncbi:MAG: PH domain-containing protein [Candidatus Marinimicrobia bacterium]|nr:PH domain-containing protein [Candidatus Neomarinimicrobiota bacterium]
MEIKPDLGKLMRREIYTLITITMSIIIIFLSIQALVVNFDPEVTNAEFVKYVWSWVAGFLIAIWIFTPWLQYLWITNLRYSIEDERLSIHKGILNKQDVSIPYSAVTDFTLSRSLYERWLDIGTILVQTAGQGAQAGGHEGKLVGLVDFDSLHAVLREKIKIYRGQGAQELKSVSQSELAGADVLKSILEEIQKINQKLK